VNTMNIYEQLKRYMKSDVNVLLMGPHGVGKTTMVKDAAQELGLRIKYYSSSTLDPWADLVGIPVPDREHERLKFLRPTDVDDAEIIFFDELNRAHSKVQDAVLEIIQYHSINGEKLPHLRMCWAAVNPSDRNYNVVEMDEVLLDRFHVHLHVPPHVDKKYFVGRGYDADIVDICIEWWQEALNDNLRRHISPRRLEYLIQQVERYGAEGIKDVIPFPVKGKVSLGLLRGRLANKLMNANAPFQIERNDLVKNVDNYIKALQGENAEGVALAIVNCLTMRRVHFNTLVSLFESGLLQKLPVEHQYHLIELTKLSKRLHEHKGKKKKVHERMAEWVKEVTGEEEENISSVDDPYADVSV